MDMSSGSSLISPTARQRNPGFCRGGTRQGWRDSATFDPRCSNPTLSRSFIVRPWLPLTCGFHFFPSLLFPLWRCSRLCAANAAFQDLERSLRVPFMKTSINRVITTYTAVFQTIVPAVTPRARKAGTLGLIWSVQGVQMLAGASCPISPW